uniref:Male-enhanced antigen 1 n=2 Tax=Clytia hemisphaerica TaxID=252671 RepID=A0A7M5V3R9_9CNID
MNFQFQRRMAPDPNNVHEKNIENEMKSEESVGNVMIINEEEFEENTSSGDDDQNAQHNAGSGIEYEGYKLLQPDDGTNGNTALDTSDSSDDEDEDEAVCKPDDYINGFASFDGPVVSGDVNIDYQHLTCGGIGDELPSTGLGFPEFIPEDEDEKELPRDDNIEMNKDKVELVMNAMANFTLPLNNIPEWAKNMSDGKWTESLAKSVQGSSKPNAD